MTFRRRAGCLAALSWLLAAPLCAGSPAGPGGAGNLFPAYGHFRKGQWRKGVSDLWTLTSMVWFIAEPNTSIKDMKRKLGEYQPGSRDYVNTQRNIRLYRELQYFLLGTALVNYLNGVLDCYTGTDDESFLAAFQAVNAFRYQTHMTTMDGYRAIDADKAGAYSGFDFGYRNVFEVYAKMFLPMPGMRMQYANFYTDYIIPFRPYGRFEFYTGLGFVAGGYSEKKVMYGGGLGLHPRLGGAYMPNPRHQFRLNLAPYMFWNEIITQDASRTDRGDGHYDLRFTERRFGDNYGLELVHRYRWSSRWFTQSILDYSQVSEPPGDYVEAGPGGSQVSIHRDREYSRLLRFDLSLNYKF